ncbi:9755_t:CDS:2 [Cetraspora pellucida]|uniref:9755_t:CDS:1 n=1 Tax=Cetraspora pellucida TaxID=1433469 RepID=A0A9N9GNI1_9GLOM|nr:9755_t:CDS:2 [Cetraspora pellucida]
MIIISYRILCCHYLQVIVIYLSTTFHISMIHFRWFKDTINNNEIEQLAMTSISQFDISNHKVDGIAHKAIEITTNSKDYSFLEILNNYIDRSTHNSSESQLNISINENQVIEKSSKDNQI